jgi:plastocyanin
VNLSSSTVLGRAALLLSAAVALAGCKPDTAVRTGSNVDHAATASQQATPPASSTPPPPDAGTVTGMVIFRGTPPPRVEIDMSMDPACAFSQNKSEQVVAEGGKLANVYVFLKGVKPSQAPAGQPPVLLDQEGCRYAPHVVAVQQGGSIQFRNSDRTMHNVHMVTSVGGNPSLDISQGPGAAPDTRKFTTPAQMVPVRCNNHPWMNAFINVADSPYFAVTGTDGRFTLSGVPPGTYTLAAVQEKMGEQDVQVTVPPHGVGKAQVSFGK